MNKAVFLDRDGTINKEIEYLHKKEDFVFITGSPEAIKELKEHGYLVGIITNQAGVGRGYYKKEDVEKLHQHINDLLKKSGTKIDFFYCCFHHPQHGKGEYGEECECRKPNPGMLLKAAAEYKIDLKHSWVVGDKLIDIEAGNRAGCRTVLVKTGYGNEEITKIEAKNKPLFIAKDLLGAVQLLLAQQSL